MEEITRMLREIQVQMDTQKHDLQNVQKSINDNINEKFVNIELKTKILEEKLEKQQQSINYLEKCVRRKNLIFFGIEEKENSYHDLENFVLNIINNKMKINYGNDSLEYVGRLGRKTGTLRPVIVTLKTVGMKINLLKKRKMLDSSNFYIKEDFPKEILNKRKQLREKLDEERKNGKNAILVYDKIIILDQSNSETETRIPYNKSNLSLSSQELISNQHLKNNRKTTKKHRNKTKN